MTTATQSTECHHVGVLYVVATPIGNLDDLSPRAQRILAEVAVVAAEDTRHSQKLLQHFGIRTPLLSLHDHNEAARIDVLRRRLQAGQSVALVSDAGTPLISDPGYRLVSVLSDEGLRCVAIPGPCAVVAALSIAGLPTDRFFFEGFLPARSAARCKQLQSLQRHSSTLVFYEAPHRLLDTLEDMASVFGAQRPAAVVREISKQYENVQRGSMESLLTYYRAHGDECRGEIVMLVQGNSDTGDGEQLQLPVAELLRMLTEAMPPSQAAQLAAQLTGLRRGDLYQRIMSEREE